MKWTSFCALVVVYSCSASVAIGQTLAFDVEKFFETNFIVDGLGTYYDKTNGQAHPFPSETGPWDLKPLSVTATTRKEASPHSEKR